jgi:putative DNA primase/helicase
MKNGLYHFDSDTLLSHSLGFFNTHSLPFAYDPTATCPMWEQFLNDVWGEDEEAKNLLMEYFGYVLSGDTKQQKYLSVIGPRRSGKGTINRILIALLGQNNVVSPQIEELCDTFALQSWLGKPLASFSDARLTGRNTTGVVSQMLRIVGGDPVTVNRKNKEALDVFLPTRIIMFSNEALQLSENSNALVGRMLMLQMTNSFYGKEDVGLYDKLTTELSGIFNMAMAANKRRLSRLGERFIQPSSAQDTLDMASEIANPLSTFIDDMLEIDTDGTIEKDDLFAVYRKWAMKQNLSVGTALSFKRRFISATQDKGVTSVRDRTTGSREYIYRGVKLNDNAQNYINSLGNFEKDGF